MIANFNRILVWGRDENTETIEHALMSLTEADRAELWRILGQLRDEMVKGTKATEAEAHSDWEHTDIATLMECLRDAEQLRTATAEELENLHRQAAAVIEGNADSLNSDE